MTPGNFDSSVSMDKDIATCSPLYNRSCDGTPTIAKYMTTRLPRPRNTKIFNMAFAVIGKNLDCEDTERIKMSMSADGKCESKTGYLTNCPAENYYVLPDSSIFCKFHCHCKNKSPTGYLIIRNVPAPPSTNHSAWSICEVFPVSSFLKIE